MSGGSLLPWLSMVLILAGGLFCLLGAIGVLRLPDCYSRMHAASKAGALGAVLVLAGVAAATSGEATMEALFALMAVLVTAPLAAHAVSRAAYHADIKPVVGKLGNVIEDERLEADPWGRSGTQTVSGGEDTASGRVVEETRLTAARGDGVSIAAPVAPPGGAVGLPTQTSASSSPVGGSAEDNSSPSAAGPTENQRNDRS